MIRVVIAEDQMLLRKGLCRLLEEARGIKVIGEAADEREAIKLARVLKPDVMVLDNDMPNTDSLEAITRLQSLKPGIRIVCLTAYAGSRIAGRLLRAGALACLPRHTVSKELVEAVRAVYHGRRYLTRGLDEVLGMQRGESDSMESVLGLLTNREMQVLQQLAAGMANRDIATALGMSPKTVDSHRLHILSKLRLRNNVDLARFAMKYRLVEAD